MVLSLLVGFVSRAYAIAPPPIQFGRDQGFVDVDLPISGMNQVNGEFRFEGQGTYEGQSTGFRLVLGKIWRAQSKPGSSLVVYWGDAVLESLGDASDRFVSVLAKKYGIESEGDLRMLPAIHVGVVGLGDDPSNVMRTPTRMKIFLHDGDKTRYAEAYVNVDAARHVLQFHEKDPGYRMNVVRALTTT